MSAILTGTPTVITWAAGATPASQNITIPSDATAVYMFWGFYDSTAGNGLASATLNGASPSQVYEIPSNTGDQSATGVAVWYSPATGSRALNVVWDSAPILGPGTIVAYVKDGSTSSWRDADAAQASGSTAVSVTLTTVAGDLVLKFDSELNNPPSLSSGWTDGGTQTNNVRGFALSSISATGATQVCDSEDENYSSLVAISIPAAGATGDMAATESGADTFAAAGGVGNNGIRLTLRDTDTGALAASLTGLIVSIRATSQATALLIAAVTNESTDGSGVLELASAAIGNVGDYVYVTVEKSDHSIVATYRVQVIDLNA